MAVCDVLPHHPPVFIYSLIYVPYVIPKSISTSHCEAAANISGLVHGCHIAQLLPVPVLE